MKSGQKRLMCTFELRLLKFVKVNIFCINSFHTLSSPARQLRMASMTGSVLYWRKHTGRRRRYCKLVQGHTFSSAVAGFQASYFVGLVPHHA